MRIRSFERDEWWLRRREEDGVWRWVYMKRTTFFADVRRRGGEWRPRIIKRWTCAE